MKWLIIVLVLFLPVQGVAYETNWGSFTEEETKTDEIKKDPYQWTVTDTILQALYATLHFMDWSQTLKIARNPDHYREINPILGEHPSEGHVNSYMAMSLVAHTGISFLLPKPWRTLWQGAGIAIKYTLVRHNESIGLEISMRF